MTNVAQPKRVRRKLRVLFATSECVPFVKTGGLADVAGALPRALKRAGAKVAVIMPKYADIPEEYRAQMHHVAHFGVPLSWRTIYCGIETLTYQGIDYYFVDNEQYFRRPGLYGYGDDPERFAFFSKAICEAILQLPELACDVLHTNDWQTALCPVFMREFYRHSELCRAIKHVFTVHNVKFQGQVSDWYLGDLLGLDVVPAAAGQLRSDERSINYLKGALSYADLITTVSPSYAVELQMPYYGQGLDWLFREKHDHVIGILNGIDQSAWDPAHDSFLPTTYSVSDLSGKALCKKSIQEELGLRVDPDCPLIVMIGRLTDQKGLGLVRYAMDRMMQHGVQFALLGTGDYDHEQAFRYFAEHYPGQCAAEIRFDNALSHRLYAAGDFLLMPSEFEPCGLSQMIAMRYGALPIVRETGGLRDTVQPYNQFTQEGTGFSFAHMNADEMCDIVLNACSLYRDRRDVYVELQQHAMQKDVSWRSAAEDYLDRYHDLHPEVIRYNKRRDR